METHTHNWLERTELLLGSEKLELLRNAHVLVVGLGGVGAYAAEMIARAGVGRMTVADADTVNGTNINRQLVQKPSRPFAKGGASFWKSTRRRMKSRSAASISTSGWVSSPIPTRTSTPRSGGRSIPTGWC